jgi:hypothetical protein
MGKILKAHFARNKIKKAIEWDEFEIDLTGYTEIQDEAAKALSECELSIDLRDLEILSDKAAEYFSNHGKSIDLAKVFELTPVAAKWLAKKRSFIHFEMPTITQEIAGIFAKGNARLKFTKLEELNDSDEHIALLNYLRETGQLGRLPSYVEIPSSVKKRFPELG